MIIFNAFGHVVFGVAVGVVAHSFGVPIQLEHMPLIVFGSLLPDIDHKRSTLGKFNPFARFMKHRGKTHTIIGAVLLCVPFFIFGHVNIPLLVFLGCISHLVADKIYSWLPRKRPFAIKLW